LPGRSNDGQLEVLKETVRTRQSLPNVDVDQQTPILRVLRQLQRFFGIVLGQTRVITSSGALADLLFYRAFSLMH